MSDYWIGVLVNAGIGVVIAYFWGQSVKRKMDRRLAERLARLEAAATRPIPVPADDPGESADHPVATA
ncbi:MAG: hypothetical protein K2X82_29035 [Gemmataceae bacterium]|nr:hypothetical protein [Gemmataceae bacterium]